MKRFLLALWCLGMLPMAQAQSPREQIAANPELSACLYHSYEYRPEADAEPAPAGYEPFYISHYGRHGSRFLIGGGDYDRPYRVLRQADSLGVLTPAGKAVYAKVATIRADAEGRLGGLTPRGTREHRGIAERMYAAYPTLFSTAGGRKCRIECRSTLVPRCILSMAAFSERLKELNPELEITRETGQRYVDYLSHGPGMQAQYKPAHVVADSMLYARVQADRLMRTLFTEPDRIVPEQKQAQTLMYDLFTLTGILQDVDYLGLSMYDLFTEEELYTLWECENVDRYLTMGPSKRFGDAAYTDAVPLLRNIVETAEAVIDGRSDLSASLRFGHDSNLIPLAALLGVEIASARVSDVDEVAAVWNAGRVSPMGTNIQLIFFRHPQTHDIRVRVLHNERDARLPIAGGPYYSWDVLHAYLLDRLDHPVPKE